MKKYMLSLVVTALIAGGVYVPTAYATAPWIPSISAGRRTYEQLPGWVSALASMRTYVDTKGKYSIQYSSDWKISKPDYSKSVFAGFVPKGDPLTIVPGTNAIFLGFTSYNLNKEIAIETGATKQESQKMLTALKKGWNSFLAEGKRQIMTGLTTGTVSYASKKYSLKTYTATQQVYTVDTDSAHVVMKLTYVTKDKKTVYILAELYTGQPNVTVKEPYRTNIRQMMQSFTIL